MLTEILVAFLEKGQFSFVCALVGIKGLRGYDRAAHYDVTFCMC